MLAEAAIALKSGFFSSGEMTRLKKVIAAAGLPVEMPRLDIKKMIQAMGHDKKVTSGKVKFVLLGTIGEVFISEDVNLSLVEEVLKG